MTVLILIVGLVVLTLGAEFLVRGASSIAARLGLSPLVIGLTVVAFGTSAPELAVSLKAALAGQGGIALGNIVGSNIFNVAAILGIAAMICPLAVHLDVIRRDMPIMLGASGLFVTFLLTGQRLERWEGMVLFLLIIVYVIRSVRVAGKEKNPEALVEFEQPKSSITLSIVLTLAGFAMLVFGARIFVDSAVSIARSLGWSEAVIGLTIVAAGTSMPELATSVVASLRRQTDIAIGNVVGSNIFNLLCIGGAAGALSPINSGALGWVDLGAMLLTSVILLPLMRSGFRLNRIEGGLLFGMFLLYLWLVWP
ncbi:MAG: calcium/sodium antiporter [Verrucomicrobiales bacterium]|nr:calcium/sodium antiporter [Verrucomicrobiales bacterium]